MEQKHNEIYASEENKVAKFTLVQHTGFVDIYKWIYNKSSWLKFSRVRIDKCPFFMRRIFDPDKNHAEFIGIYTDEKGLRNIYEWRT